MTTRKKLPIGIQTFREIRENNYYYVDKTQLALNLVQDLKHCFLSRPSRFGKSLFLDTLKELFEGNEALFQGLAAQDQWDWSVKYPVLRFSFVSGNFGEAEYLQQALSEQMDVLEAQYHYKPRARSVDGRFQDLIEHLHEQTNRRVVILVDEYDKPILDAFDYPEVAKANRDFLLSFYSTIKDYDAHIEFSLLAGVSNFPRSGLFSGLNNLTDITLDRRYAAICGYTDHDIDMVFAPELMGLNREDIREWYNGYNWLGESVYNPYAVLKLFDTREFKNYWFENNTPAFLVDALSQRQVDSINLDDRPSSSSMLSNLNFDRIGIEALLFQTGYLTIKRTENLGGLSFYMLGYPNHEVKISLHLSLLSTYGADQSAVARNRLQLIRTLQAHQLDDLKNVFQAFFASIPDSWYTKNNIEDYEGYYASVFYSYFATLGLDLTVEDATSSGRVDMTLLFNERVYIFEFKVLENSGKGSAMHQLQDKKYADKYRHLNQPIYLIGVEFSKVGRNIAGFEVVEA